MQSESAVQVALHAKVEAHSKSALQELLVATQVCATPSQVEVLRVEPEHESVEQDVAPGV
jgi:hypothetical protein